MTDQPIEESIDQPKTDAKPSKTQARSEQQVIVVQQHSMILYWWPVWVFGFIFAAVSFLFGEQITIGGQTMWFYPSRSVGVIYLTLSAIVFLKTNVVFRGVASLVVALGTIILVLLCSLFGLWDTLFSMEQHLSIHMDGGFYLIVAAFVFAAWAITIFVVDRFTHCEFRRGQLIVRNLMGGGSRTYDTRGMAVYKLQDDPLRHWILGLGTGDLHIATTGAESFTIDVRNVAFLDRKLDAIKKLIATSPDGAAEG